MNFHTDTYESCSDQVTKEIKDLYMLHASNYAAATIQGIDIINNPFDSTAIDDAIQHLNNKMKAIPEETHPYLLNQYSNPVL